MPADRAPLTGPRACPGATGLSPGCGLPGHFLRVCVASVRPEASGFDVAVESFLMRHLRTGFFPPTLGSRVSPHLC